MILLTTTNSYLQVSVGTAVSTIYVQVSFVDLNGTNMTPNYQNTLITGSGTASVTPSVASSTQRAIKFVSIQNGSASSTKITVIHTDGAIAVNIFVYVLNSGECIYFAEGKGWYAVDANGNEKTSTTSTPQNLIVGEVVAGSGTAFTLAKTPILGTVALYNASARLFPTIDYTPLTGASITMNYAISSGSLYADYWHS